MNKRLNSFLRRQEGQSLVEILVGLAIGALLIGTATVGVVFVLKSSTTNQNLSTGNNLTEGILDNVRSFAAANWSGLYNLTHGATSTYFIVASGTTLLTAPGEEGVLGSDVANGLVGHWGLDEGTGTVSYDTSGYLAKNLTLVNSPSWISGEISGALSFNSSSTYVVNNTGGFLPTGSSTRTITFWGYPLSSGNYPAAVAYGCSSEGYGCSDSGKGTYVSVEASTNWGFKLDAETCGTTAMVIPSPQQAWHFFSAVFNGDNTVTFYIDSVAGAPVTPPCTLNTAIGNGISVGVGRWGYYNGYLDDIRIYNRALSASEISELYKAQPFSRYFYVQDVCRTNDASSSIVGNAPCSGSNWDDPSTQQVTAVTQWPAGPSNDQTTLSTYLTRYQNFTLRQSDWSGGPGQTGPLSIPNTQYASGSNVTGTSTLGSFQIQNLTQH